MQFELIVLNGLRLKKPVVISTPMLLLIKNILDEELVRVEKEEPPVWVGSLGASCVALTDKGQKFIDEWVSANKDLTY
jgi:hypothetical protein